MESNKITHQFLEEFVYESNLIDPQPGHENKPGDPHFDDHLKAAEMAADFAEMNVIAPPDVIHKTLMQRLKGMEKHAGKLRTVAVMVGSHMCPSPSMVPSLLMNWNSMVLTDIALNWSVLEDNKKEREDLAWKIHTHYERVHPWIDGNARSGRILMLNHRLLLGLDPIIIKYSERFDYYKRF